MESSLDETSENDWRSDVINRLAPHVTGLSFSEIDVDDRRNPYLSIERKNVKGSSGVATLDLRDIPSNQQVTIEVRHIPELTIVGIRENVRLTLNLIPMPGKAQARLTFSDECSGEVVLNAGTLLRGLTLRRENRSLTLRIKSGSVALHELDELDDEDNPVVIEGRAILHGFTSCPLVLRADVTWGSAVSGGQLGAKDLLVDGDRVLSVDPTHLDTFRIDKVHSLPSARALLTMQSDFDGFFPGAEPRLTLGSVNNVDIALISGLSVVIEESMTASTIAADSKVTFGSGSVSDDVTFSRLGKRAPTVETGRAASLLNVTGEIVLGAVASCHIEGKREQPVSVTGLRQSDSVRDSKGLHLRNFTLPRGLDGRAVLTGLDSSSHLEPATSDLPGWDRRGKRVKKDSKDASVQSDAELLRELRRLAHEKGTSGASRTKIGWCAQRLRHATTSGRVESWCLTAYRMLGYGERPLPAFATWLAMAAALAIISSAPQIFDNWWNLEPSASAWGLYGVELLRNLSGPIGAVTRTGTSPTLGAIEPLLRALLAIPLLVGALSLRNYVRVA